MCSAYSVDGVLLLRGFPAGVDNTRPAGRESECAELDALLDAARRGESRVLLLAGEPGVGKTALLEYLASRAADCQLIDVAGIESEAELAFAGLHQLCVCRSWIASPLCRRRRARRCGACSACDRGRHRTGFWWALPS
jgi:hypothetical protein